MRLWLPKFRDHVGIEQISFHRNSTLGRRRKRRRSGTRFSNRGPGPTSRSLRLGRAEFCRRCHSWIGTRTAVSIPRRVTTCGPFLIVASSNSLKRAFASCTCQEAIGNLQETSIQLVIWSTNPFPSLITFLVRRD